MHKDRGGEFPSSINSNFQKTFQIIFHQFF
nr:MAG TPA: protein of unknown function (DUF2610) [Caudoviricetes sp.]DAT42803.1 MAG TPA: protein of unknown function (DUF2610) [Caudoviricetes sp.]